MLQCDHIAEESNKLFSNSQIDYTAHHNWSWVLNTAINQLCNDRSVGLITAHLCNSCKELPSQSSQKKLEKVKYALFRVEVTEDSSRLLNNNTCPRGPRVSVWATSLAFAFLDPKDALYRELLLQNAGYLMPKTSLLSWDIDSLDEIGELPSSPALLKASLGSGGFGLYFVSNCEDVLSIIRAHSARARSFDGFLDSLRRDHGGDVPCWSLQSLVNSYRVLGVSNNVPCILSKECKTTPAANTNINNIPSIQSFGNNKNSYNDRISTTSDSECDPRRKRCQIRVYVVFCGGHLYMYDTFEARMPSWDVDLDEVLTPSSKMTSNKNSSEPGPSDSVLRNQKEGKESTTTNSDSGESPSNQRIEKNKITLDDSTSEKKILTVDEFEEYCCCTSSARPYNKNRNKSVTERFIFDELDDLLNTDAKHVVGNCVRAAMNALKIPILKQILPASNNEIINHKDTEVCGDSTRGKHQEMAIAGIDLMLEISEENQNEKKYTDHAPVLTAYILEINNNPAMAGEDKKMSVKYKDHLISFVKNLLLLGLNEMMSEGFEIVW